MRSSGLLDIHLEECLSSNGIRRSKIDFFIQSSGSQYRRIEMIGTIGRSDHDEIRCIFERIEFLEELTHFFCLVGIDIVRTSGDERIDLIEKENDCFMFGCFLGSCEKIPDILGCLMEIGGSELSHILRDEPTSELFGELLGDEGFSGSRRSIEEHSSRNRDLELLVCSVETFE